VEAGINFPCFHGVARRFVVLASLCLAMAPGQAEEIIESALPRADSTINLPYGFWNETFGFAAGYVYAVNGSPQPQAGMVASVMVGSEGSAMGFLMGQNIRPVRSLERLFVDPILSIGYFDNADVFIDGNPDFPDERAGSNDSDPDNFITGRGRDTFARARFKYLLPIGTGRERILPAFQFDGGLLTDGANGGDAFNPWNNGLTYVELMPFFRSQNVENDLVDTAWSKTGRLRSAARRWADCGACVPTLRNASTTRRASIIRPSCVLFRSGTRWSTCRRCRSASVYSGFRWCPSSRSAGSRRRGTSRNCTAI